MAQRIYRNALQGKPDQERKQGYQERDRKNKNGINEWIIRLIVEWICNLLDRLRSYSNFDAKLRRPDYIKFVA